MAGFRGFVVRSATRTNGTDAREGASRTGMNGRSMTQTCTAPETTRETVSVAASDAAGASGLPRALVDRIRREWFARAGGVASRYGVLLDEALAHLREANLAETPGPARALSFLEDLVCAVACVRGHPGAWQDLWERHESILLRASRLRLGDVDAVIATRRFWRELHAITTLPEHDRAGLHGRESFPPSLVEYVGVRPLRVWLSDRLLEQIERNGIDARLERAPRRAACRGGDRLAERFESHEATASLRMRLVD